MENSTQWLNRQHAIEDEKRKAAAQAVSNVSCLAYVALKGIRFSTREGLLAAHEVAQLAVLPSVESPMRLSFSEVLLTYRALKENASRSAVQDIHHEHVMAYGALLEIMDYQTNMAVMRGLPDPFNFALMWAARDLAPDAPSATKKA